MGIYRWRNFHRKRISHRDLDQAEAKHLQFNRIRDCWSPRLNDGYIMEKVLMEDQGYQVMENIFYQDNKSTILLDKNGK